MQRIPFHKVQVGQSFRTLSESALGKVWWTKNGWDYADMVNDTCQSGFDVNEEVDKLAEHH